jgi:hypothetical protein
VDVIRTDQLKLIIPSPDDLKGAARASERRSSFAYAYQLNQALNRCHDVIEMLLNAGTNVGCRPFRGCAEGLANKNFDLHGAFLV